MKKLCNLLSYSSSKSTFTVVLLSVSIMLSVWTSVSIAVSASDGMCQMYSSKDGDSYWYTNLIYYSDCMIHLYVCYLSSLSFFLYINWSIITIGMLWVAVANATTSMVVDSACRHCNASEVRRQVLPPVMEPTASHGHT